MTSFINQVTGQPVLFITTKNTDYIRNAQELALLKKYAASVHIIGSSSPSYPIRLFSVWLNLLFISARNFPVVFIGFAPQLVTPFFSFKFRKSYIIEDFFISLYDTFVCDRQKFSPGSIPARLLHRLDALTLRKAALIISDTKTHGAYFSSEFHIDKSLIETLYLEADRSIYYPRQKTADNTVFRILYFGSILPLQGLPVILNAISRLMSRKELQFTIIGPIPAAQEKPEGENIRYIHWLPQEALAEEIGKADLCLAGHFHPAIQKAQRTIPGKAYIYEAMGKPMILGDNPATRELEHHWKVPVSYVPMGDDKALANCILQQMNILRGKN